LTVYLYDCSPSGSPISGATVTITGLPSSPGPTTVTGSTNGSGYYQYCHSATLGGSVVVTVTYGDMTYSYPWFFCTSTTTLCYTKVQVNATITTAAEPTLTSSVGGGTYPFTLTVDGSTATFVYETLQECFNPGLFPGTYTFYALPGVDNYLSNCVTVTLNCGDNVDIDLTEYDLDPCYFDYSDYHCDLGCETWGKGPNYRGAVSKQMQITFNTAAGRCTLFADDEGVPIILTGSQTFDMFGNPDGWLWDSGCRGGQGNYQSLNAGYCDDYVSSNLNCPVPYEIERVGYSSTRVTMTGSTLTYARYSLPGCVPITGYCYNQCGYVGPGYACDGEIQTVGPNTGYLCSDCYTGVASQPTETFFEGNKVIDGIFLFLYALYCTPCEFVIGQTYYAPFWYFGNEPPVSSPSDPVIWYALVTEYCDGTAGPTPDPVPVGGD
jgi:hypothetical protein